MIYNYSSAPLSEFMQSRVIDIELEHGFEFDYTPTIQEITKRCEIIVDFAIKNNHKRVYLKNFSTFQSHLIQAFQSQNIRVFVPLYKDMSLTEVVISYNTHNEVAYFNEIGLYELNASSLMTVEYMGHQETEFRFKSDRSSITISIDESFIDEVRTNNIHRLMTSKYNIIISNDFSS